MTPWFIATEPFEPSDGQRWDKYVEWSGLRQLQELVSLDELLCPPLLRVIREEDWPYIVNDDFMMHFFTDFDFLMERVAPIERRNVLCVYRNPTGPPNGPFGDFRFLGYDLVDKEGSISALTNCGGFPDVFANSELSNLGLLTDFRRAIEIQEDLRRLHPEERHSNCHLWAILRLAPR